MTQKHFGLKKCKQRMSCLKSNRNPEWSNQHFGVPRHLQPNQTPFLTYDHKVLYILLPLPCFPTDLLCLNPKLYNEVEGGTYVDDRDLWRILYGREILCLQTWIVKYVIFEVGFPLSKAPWFSGYFVNLASARRGGPSLSHGWFQGCRRLSNGIQLDKQLMAIEISLLLPKKS